MRLNAYKIVLSKSDKESTGKATRQSETRQSEKIVNSDTVCVCVSVCECTRVGR